MLDNIVCGDAETYYDRKTFSLAKKDMTTQGYIEDPRFQLIGWGLGGAHTNAPIWIPGEARRELSLIDWDDTTFIAHNAQFDGGILDYHYGIHPKYMICTMAMAQTLGIGKLTGSVSLAMLARFFGFQDKGTEVGDANGKRLEDFSPLELYRYGEYCKNDVSLEVKLFRMLEPYIDIEELRWHSLVNKAFTEPECRLNLKTLEDELQRVLTRNAEVQQEAAKMVGCNVDELKKVLGSSIKFAELLREYGVEPPMKISKATGKETYAFAKNDKAFMALSEHEDSSVQAIVAARLGVKSTTEQSRVEKMIVLAKLPSGRLRVPLKISGAHTHRGSGKDGLNFQNFPSGRVAGQSKALRRSIEALDGQYLTAPDSGQIEARVLAFIANDTELLQIFADGECPYSAMAAEIYGVDRYEIKRGSDMYSETKDKAYFEFYMMRQTGKAAVLQLGYQAGAASFFTSLVGQYRVTTVESDQCDHIVKVYRKKRQAVVNFWEQCEQVLNAMIKGGQGHFGGPDGSLFYYNGRQEWFGHTVPSIKLPNNTWLTYPELQLIKEDGDWRKQKIYLQDLRKFKNAVGKGQDRKAVLLKQGKRIYGGSLTENLCQALAFAALKYQALEMDGKFISNVHDEHIMAVNHMMHGFEYQACMMKTPPYLEGIVFDCDFVVANNYAEC